MDEFFKATVDATEEAIINALVAANTLEGRDGNKAWRITDPNLPGKSLLQVMKEYNRLSKSTAKKGGHSDYRQMPVGRKQAG